MSGLTLYGVFAPADWESSPLLMSLWDDDTLAGLEAIRLDEKYHRGKPYYYVEPIELNQPWREE